MAVYLENTLKLYSCPHCKIDNPDLVRHSDITTKDCEGLRARLWRIYICQRCGGIITASGDGIGSYAKELYPKIADIDTAIPDRAREYLRQAVQSIHSPSGAVMLAACAVDAMLTNKSYVEGSLYTRIDKAAEDHLITKDMAKWAHEVRLDANEQRHPDPDAGLPTETDAERSIAFVKALGEFMFILPARVTRGLTAAQPPAASKN
jgi:hypothetical protein